MTQKEHDPQSEKSSSNQVIVSAGMFAHVGHAGEAAPADEIIDVEYEVLRATVRPGKGLSMPRAAPANRTAASEARPGHGTLSGEHARDALAGWGHAHGQSPAPRHRRRLILKWARPLEFADCLDAGCGDGSLLRDIVRQGAAIERPITGFGCDANLDETLLGQGDAEGCTFLKLDPSRESWPDQRQFDLVVCSELLGQVPQWRDTLANLIRMTRKYLLLTVPAGPIRMADRIAGHQQHFDGMDLAGAVVGRGLTLLKQRRWGFPVHSLYQSTLDRLPSASELRHRGDPGSSLPMRLVAEGLYLAFFSNDLFHGGAQQILLAERR